MIELKGVEVAKALSAEMKEKVAGFARKPLLAIVMVGHDPGSVSYVTGAKKRMQKIGIECREVLFPEDTENAVFQAAFKELNADETVDGIIVMTPLPKQIDYNETLKNLDPEKDMDAQTDESRVRIYMGKEGIRPCTPEAVIAMLDFYGIEIAGKKAAVIGRSLNVGKPVFHMLTERNATVTLCHSKTPDLPAVARNADILVVTIGKAEFVDDSFVKEGAAVLDVGINVNAEGKLCGDVNYEKVSAVAGALSPVPGGVGSVTTTMLASHVIRAYEKKAGI